MHTTCTLIETIHKDIHFHVQVNKRWNQLPHKNWILYVIIHVIQVSGNYRRDIFPHYIIFIFLQKCNSNNHKINELGICKRVSEPLEWIYRLTGSTWPHAHALGIVKKADIFRRAVYMHCMLKISHAIQCLGGSRGSCTCTRGWACIDYTCTCTIITYGRASMSPSVTKLLYTSIQGHQSTMPNGVKDNWWHTHSETSGTLQ